MTNLKRLIITICMFGNAIAACGQNDDCELTISRALEEFNAGHFYSIPATLNPCLNQFTKEQKQRAYLLLTQTYLLLDDPIGAKQSYINVLRANPEFLTDTAIHPIDVIYLSKKFTATSIFSWFVKAGPNLSIVRPIYHLSAIGDPSVSEKYQISLGYQAMAGGDLNVNEKLAIRAELGYSQVSFRQQSLNYFTQDRKLVTEQDNWIAVPVSVVYSDAVGKYRPYAYAGYGAQYLLASHTTVTITNNKPIVNKEDVRDGSVAESPSLNSKFKRNPFNQSVIVGGGVKVKLGLDFLFVDVRYSMGMKNMTSKNSVYSDSQLDQTSDQYIQTNEISMRYGEVQDYFRLDNLSISVGFLRPLYKPRELKRARTKSVMNNTKR